MPDDTKLPGGRKLQLTEKEKLVLSKDLKDMTSREKVLYLRVLLRLKGIVP